MTTENEASKFVRGRVREGLSKFMLQVLSAEPLASYKTFHLFSKIKVIS